MGLTKDILEREGIDVVRTIQSKLSSTGANATGKTSRSLEMEATETRLKIEGSKSFLFVETGRRAGRRPPIAPLKEWAIAKGLARDDKQATGIAFAVATKIANYGTSTVSINNPRDIYQSVITDEKVESIYNQIKGVFADKVLSDVIQNMKTK
jgi:hypothetical protein